MKLKLTGYKSMAAKNAVRIQVDGVDNKPNIKKIIKQSIFCDLATKLDIEFCEAVITSNWKLARGEHQAIYFWIE